MRPCWTRHANTDALRATRYTIEVRGGRSGPSVTKTMRESTGSIINLPAGARPENAKIGGGRKTAVQHAAQALHFSKPAPAPAPARGAARKSGVWLTRGSSDSDVTTASSSCSAFGVLVTPYSCDRATDLGTSSDTCVDVR